MESDDYQYGVQWADNHGDTRIDIASSRDTAAASAESLRVIQQRRGQAPDAHVIVRPVGDWIDVETLDRNAEYERNAELMSELIDPDPDYGKDLDHDYFDEPPF